MPTLAAYATMMERVGGEKVSGYVEPWLIGVSVRDYREIEAGDRMPSLATYLRIFELYGWPQTFVGQ